MMDRSDPQGGAKGGRYKKGVGMGQTIVSDSGPSRGEERKNYNPTLKKGGNMVGGGPNDLSHSITSGKVPSGQ